MVLHQVVVCTSCIVRARALLHLSSDSEVAAAKRGTLSHVADPQLRHVRSLRSGPRWCAIRERWHNALTPVHELPNCNLPLRNVHPSGDLR